MVENRVKNWWSMQYARHGRVKAPIIFSTVFSLFVFCFLEKKTVVNIDAVTCRRKDGGQQSVKIGKQI